MKNPRLSPISYIVSILIGLGTLDALSAKTRGSERNIAITNSQHYLPQMTLGGFYGDKGNSYGSTDFFIPLAQRADSLMFVDVRGVFREHPQQEYNLGAGYRWLNSDVTQMYGVYGFFDRKRSGQNDWYNQITLGAEWKLKDWSFGGNAYIPVGTTKNITKSVDSSGAEVYQGDKFIIGYQNNIETEYAMHGFDFEAGYTLPALPELTARLGGFYFNHKDTKAIVGPRAGLSYDFAPMLGKSFNWISSLSVETSYQYDNSRHGIVYAGIQLTVPIGSQAKRPEGLRKAMTSFVRRDLDIVIDKDSIFEVGQARNADGSLIVGKVVSTEAELNAATTAGSGIDLIGVNGQISVAGVAYTDGSTAAAVKLLKGQSITGGSFTYTEGGVTHTTPIVNSANGISGANPNATSHGGLTLTGTNGDVGHLLQVYTSANGVSDTQVIQDMILRVPTSTTAVQRSAAITNETGRLGANDAGTGSFGNVIINNVNSNGAIAFTTDTGETGGLTVKDSTINLVNASSSGAISALSAQKKGITINSISNNTISVVNNESASAASGMVFSWLNGPVTDNTFSAVTSASAGAIGVAITSDLTSTGIISGNMFTTITSGGENKVAYGLSVLGELAGTINNNEFTTISSSKGDAVRATASKFLAE